MFEAVYRDEVYTVYYVNVNNDKIEFLIYFNDGYVLVDSSECKKYDNIWG